MLTMSDTESKKKVLKFQDEPAVQRYLPYSYHVTDHILSTTGNEYLMIFRVPGRAFDCSSRGDRKQWRDDLNHLIRSVGNQHVKFWSHLHHRATDEFTRAEYPLTFPRELDRKYFAMFNDRPMMVNDMYLSIVYNPIGDLTQKMLSMFDKPSREQLDDMQQEAITALNDIAFQVMGSMKPYGIEKLGIYYRDENGRRIVQRTADEDDDLDEDEREEMEGVYVPPVAAETDLDDAYAYSSLLEWLAFLVNGEKRPMPVTRSRARDYLAFNRLISSAFGDVMQVRGEASDRYVAGLEVMDWPEKTKPGQFNPLMNLDFEFVLTQTFDCMSSIAAAQFLTNQQKALLETADKSPSLVQEIDDAIDDAAAKRFVLGHYHATLLTWADSAKHGKNAPKVAQNQAREARVAWDQCGVVSSALGMASEAAYYAQLPCLQKFAPRPAAINSWNFLSFSPFHTYMTGKPANNPWGPAITVFRTEAGTPVFFNFHNTPLGEDSYNKRPAGHTLMLGKTGEGKTTLLNKILSDCTKYNPRGVFFDKDQGMYPLVLALKGNYTVLRDGVETGWQPAQMEPTRRNIGFVKRLLRLLAEKSLGDRLYLNEVNDLGFAVDAVMGGKTGEAGTIPMHERTLTAIVQHLPNPTRMGAEDRPTLAAMLEPWTRGFEHGWLFDNDSDSLDFNTHDIHGFDLTEFISNDQSQAPVAREPMLMYLMFRVNSAIDGRRRFLQVFDEFAQYLDDPTIRVEVKKALKVNRKKDAVCLFATQEANDALASEIGKTIVQMAATLILMCNPQATEDDYIDGMRLTKAEYDAMIQIPEYSRKFLIKQGNQSTVAQMQLIGMDDEISILSGTPDNAERLVNIVNREGSLDPDVWLKKYYDAVRRAA